MEKWFKEWKVQTGRKLELDGRVGNQNSVGSYFSLLRPFGAQLGYFVRTYGNI